MSTILVSILSKHTLPNYLFIREMEGKYDELLFITTPEVDKDNRGFQLQSALGKEEGDVVYVSVDGNDYRKALDDLRNWEIRKDDKYIVNLTGGTKMMSLAVHDFFLNFDTCFYYVPIGKNQYYNLSTGIWLPLLYRASLKEYFALYGMKYTCDNTLTHSEEQTKALFEEVRYRRFRLPFKLIHARDEGVWQTPEDKRYYGGGWFEEYTYSRIKRQYRLRDEDIALSLKIYRNKVQATNDNELDVTFIRDNALYVIECKVTMMGFNATVPHTIETYLYKLAAISKDYGLVVNPYLFTLHQLSTLSKGTLHNLDKRCRILGIKGIIGPQDLSNNQLNLE